MHFCYDNPGTPNFLIYNLWHGISAGTVWIDPYRSNTIIMWQYPWISYIIAVLVSDTNLGGMHINYNLDISTLILPHDNLLAECTEANMSTRGSVLYNTPIISCITWEMATINPVVEILLHILTLHSRKFPLKPSAFYHTINNNNNNMLLYYL